MGLKEVEEPLPIGPARRGQLWQSGSPLGVKLAFN
jgi:hypothetical protein